MKGYTNKTFEPTFNPKKNNSDRRIRRKVLKATKAIAYAEIKTKSQSGVEYTHYMPTVVNI
jgi:hypothetical protein